MLNLVAGNGWQCIDDVMDTKTSSSEQCNDAKNEIYQRSKCASGLRSGGLVERYRRVG